VTAPMPSHSLPDPAHWPEYAIEAALLGLFMLSACACTVLVEHPASLVRTRIGDPLARRALVGAAMGATAITLVYSPWGRRSGAHFNPAVTIAFHRLGRIGTRDAVAYVLAQGLGGLAGVLVAWLVLGMLVAHPAVAFATTVPGPAGAGTAFAAEVAISFVQMSAVLWLANGRFARRTGVVAGLLVATWITFEAPLSGMSMNPARSLASAATANVWSGFWIYLSAPLLGMLAAAETYARTRGLERVSCAKLHHPASAARCIFRCDRRAATDLATTARPTTARPTTGVPAAAAGATALVGRGGARGGATGGGR